MEPDRRSRRNLFRNRGELTELKRVPMEDNESAVAVSGGVPGAGREPTIQVGKSYARRLAFDFVITRVANVLVNNAVGVQVRCVTYPTVPTTIMPCQSRGEMCRHLLTLAGLCQRLQHPVSASGAECPPEGCGPDIAR